MIHIFVVNISTEFSHQISNDDYRGLSAIKSPSILLSINFNNDIVCIITIFLKISDSFYIIIWRFEIIPSALLIMGMICLDIYLSSNLEFQPVVCWNGYIQYRTNFHFLCQQQENLISKCYLKRTKEIMFFLFLKLFSYLLFVMLNLNCLHNSQWITVPTQLHLFSLPFLDYVANWNVH